MSGLLKEAGYNVITDYIDETDKSIANQSSNNNSINNPADIDVVIINSCTVKNLAESKFFKELRKWQKKDVKILVAGCITQAEPELLDGILRDVSVIGTRRLSSVVNMVTKLLSGKIVHDIANDSNERLNLPKVRRTGMIEILPISEGCMSNCSFCKTKLARGELLSYPKEKIITQFKSALLDGCKEFWITSQDCGCYGFDIYRKEKYFLPQLLDDLLRAGDILKRDFRIRLGMCNPDHIDRIKDDLVKIYQHPNMFKFLHIPVQSGSDKVLKNMRRAHTIEKFTGIVDLFRRKIPEITLSSDLIIGFPLESDKDFLDSMDLVRDVKFDVLNISRFWSRKGTDAALMKQLPSDLIKSRTIKLKDLFDKLLEEHNKKFFGEEFIVLIDEISSGNFIGRNDYYKQVVIKESDGLTLGIRVKVRITQTTKYKLFGDVILKDINSMKRYEK
jgi:MiaB-like tRNA modifying enzyme